jgi:Fe-S oxidoreductase
MMSEKEIVERIRHYGSYKDLGEGRKRVLTREIDFPMDERAEHVLIGGCLLPELMPGVFRDLRSLLGLLKVDYTMLSKENCCGWVPLLQPAVRAKDDQRVARVKEISKNFIFENFKKADELGARSIVIFCSGCYTSLNKALGHEYETKMLPQFVLEALQ